MSPIARGVVVGTLIAVSLGGPVAGRQARPSAAAPPPVPGRSVVATTLGIVAASQPLAARAGVQILERGGNAIDAAIAANATIGLMEPTGNGIGGDLFILYYEAKTGTVHGLNASGWAPTGLTPEFLAVEGHHGDAAARHLLGDGAGRRRRVGRDARAVRHQAVRRAAGAGDPLRRAGLPAVAR